MELASQLAEYAIEIAIRKVQLLVKSDSNSRLVSKAVKLKLIKYPEIVTGYFTIASRFTRGQERVYELTEEVNHAIKNKVKRVVKHTSENIKTNKMTNERITEIQRKRSREARRMRNIKRGK